MITVLALVAATLLVVRLVLFARLHVMDSPYHPVRHAVSDYAVGTTRPLALTMTRLAAAAWFVLAALTWVALPDWGYRATAVALLAGVGALTLVMQAFPTDLEGERLTRIGLVHYVLAIATFGMSYSLTGNLSRLAADEHWPGYAPVLGALHWVALVSLVGVCVTLAPRLRGVFGLVERVFLVAIALFYLVYALALLVL